MNSGVYSVEKCPDFADVFECCNSLRSNTESSLRLCDGCLGHFFTSSAPTLNVPHANVKGKLINAAYNLDEGLMQNKTA